MKIRVSLEYSVSYCGSIHKEKDILKFQKLQKIICETAPFSLTLQPCIREFLTSENPDYKKNVSFEYSEIVESLP